MKRSVGGLVLILTAAQGQCFAQDSAPSPSRSVPAATLSFQPVSSEPVIKPAEVPNEPGLRIWGTAEYLLWWVRRGNVPPLVVTGSATDPFPGALEQPGTRVLFGGHALDY